VLRELVGVPFQSRPIADRGFWGRPIYGLVFSRSVLSGTVVGKKFEAYTSIINALHDMAQSITHEIEEYVEPVLPDDELFNRTPSQERAEQIRKQYNEKHKIARDELRRRTDIGEFIISPQAVILLRALWKDLAERGEDYISDLEGGVKAVNDCLEQMRQLANDDLRGHTFPRWRAP